MASRAVFVLYVLQILLFNAFSSDGQPIDKRCKENDPSLDKCLETIVDLLAQGTGRGDDLATPRVDEHRESTGNHEAPADRRNLLWRSLEDEEFIRTHKAGLDMLGIPVSFPKFSFPQSFPTFPTISEEQRQKWEKQSKMVDEAIAFDKEFESFEEHLRNTDFNFTTSKPLFPKRDRIPLAFIKLALLVVLSVILIIISLIKVACKRLLQLCSKRSKSKGKNQGMEFEKDDEPISVA